MNTYICTYFHLFIFMLILKDLIKYFPLNNLEKCSLCNNAIIVEVSSFIIFDLNVNINNIVCI